jgi:SAM-dependent methyltransferase
MPHERVHYVRAAAERAPLRTGSADLVTVAQALHWFDTGRFFAEVRRVLAPAGVIAAWSYDLPRVGPGIDEALRHYYSDVVGPYWAPERRIVEDAYRSIEFPFDEIAMEPFEITAALTLDEFAGYASTWSATLAFAADRGTDPVSILRASLLPHWAEGTRTVRWPVTVRAGRT